MANSRTGIGKIQDDLGVSSNIRRLENTKKKKQTTPQSGGHIKRTEKPTERASSGQSWNYLSKKNKVVLEYNTKYKIYIMSLWIYMTE